MKTHVHTVIVFATWMEAEPFLLRTDAEYLRAEPYGLLRVADRHLLVLICGMGPESASGAIAFLLRNFRVAHICNCGVAGALTDAIRIGDISSVHFVAPGEDRNSLDFIFLSGWPERAGHRPCRLISLDHGLFESRRRRYWQGFADLVDMEGAAIAQACKQARVPCHIYKAVSDNACDRRVLQRNIEHVSARMADWLCDKLPRLQAQGAV